MNPLLIPTDNLYKFMALTGTILLLIVFVYPQLIVDKFEKETIKAITEQEILLLELELISNDVDSYLQTVKTYGEKLDEDMGIYKALKEEMVKEKISRTKLLEFVAIQEKDRYKIQALMDQKKYDIKRKQIEYKMKNKEVLSKEKVLNLLSKQITRVLNFSYGMSIIGTLMLVNGFYFWYIRVQVPNDKKIKLESVKNKKSRNYNS